MSILNGRRKILLRDAPCFCGSGQRFKHCCGAADRRRRVPHGIELRAGFVDPETCRRWVERLEQPPRVWLETFDHERSTPECVVRSSHPGRVAERASPGHDWAHAPRPFAANRNGDAEFFAGIEAPIPYDLPIIHFPSEQQTT